MIIIPLLDDNLKPHAVNMTVAIDLSKLIAELLSGGKVVTRIKLKMVDGKVYPTDPLTANSPRSAFEHTVNVFCNKHNNAVINSEKPLAGIADRAIGELQ